MYEMYASRGELKKKSSSFALDCIINGQNLRPLAVIKGMIKNYYSLCFLYMFTIFRQNFPSKTLHGAGVVDKCYLNLLCIVFRAGNCCRLQYVGPFDF